MLHSPRSAERLFIGGVNMKNKYILSILTMLLVITVLLSSCTNNEVVETKILYTIKSGTTTLHILPIFFNTFLGEESGEEFCNTKGHLYHQAEVAECGCVVLTLDSKDIPEWKSKITLLQILQCVLGEYRDIGVKVDYSQDVFGLMKNADSCEFEISDDFTKVVVSAAEIFGKIRFSFYYAYITMACAVMQIFEGKTCEEINVEVTYLTKSGEVLDVLNYPWEVDKKISFTLEEVME